MAQNNRKQSKAYQNSRYARAKRYGRRATTVLVIILIALVALGLSGFRFAYADMLPNVVEMQEEEAADVLEEHGVQIEVQRDWSDTYEEGMVISQSPQGGSHVKSGEVVSILISKGKQETEMPNLLEKRKEEATQLLDETGLPWIVSEIYSEEVDAGQVIRQNPDPGMMLEPGAEVVLVVSKGSKSEIRTARDVEVVRK